MQEITKTAGVAVVEKPTEKEPEKEEQKPEVKTDGTVNGDDPDIRRLARGIAIEEGWRPASEQKPDVKAPNFIENTDIPKPDKYDKWVEDGNQDAIDAYVSAVKVARNESGAKSSEQQSRLEKLEATITHQMAVSQASASLSDEYKPYLDKAVQNMVEINGGNPIPDASPRMVRLIKNEAIALAVESGALEKKRTPVGETIGGDTSSGVKFPQALLDSVKKEFASQGMPVDDAYASDYLQRSGHVAG